ncbi:MAG: restriction endonuclease subunit S [Deltaproteobacteria bacterium]|nr:restriction endonuclease subunit S [Deltaproteobacteria bacterium]
MGEERETIVLGEEVKMQYQILNYSTTMQDDGTFRLDAEHYQEQFLMNQERLIRFGSTPLLKLISQQVKTGHTPSMKIESYYGGDISFVKTDNLRDFKISGEFSHYLSKSGNEIIKRSALKNDDLIVTIIGATQKIVGRAALVRKENLPANINQNIALIRLKKQYSPEFLSAYLNCKIGRLAVWYLSRQTEQVNLNCREIEKVLVPNISDVFVSSIEDIYKKAVACEHDSRSAYKKAQNFLLSELGLSNWQPKHQLTFIKNYSNGHDELGNLVSIRKCIEVGSDEYLNEGIPFIRVSDLSSFELTEEKYISKELYFELAQHQPKKGEILLSKDATPGIAYFLRENSRKMIPSGGILRLKLKDNRLNEDYLTLVLNSLIVKEQINRDVGGSVILHWRPDQIKETLIPILPKTDQGKIKEKIIHSFELRKQSKHLLDSAKHAVEIAIEQDEGAAIKWLEEQTESRKH